MNRIGILDDYNYGSFGDFAGTRRRKKRKSRRRKLSTKQRQHMARFKKAAKSCGRRRKGTFKACMKKKLKKKGRR